jgi:hypothetical protein
MSEAEGVGSGVFNFSCFPQISNFLICRFLFRHGLVRIPPACPGASFAARQEQKWEQTNWT